jgi:hypothetical protein
MLRSLVATLLICSACVSQQIPAPPSTMPVPMPSVHAGSPTPTVQSVSFGNGLELDVPTGWAWSNATEMVNRATYRYLIASNGPLGGFPVLVGNGDVDAAALPSGRVVVQVLLYCRLSCSGPQDETALPLDWSMAGRLNERALPPDRHELGLGFRWFDRPMFVVARWAADAPQGDLTAIADIARSVRPDPTLPSAGDYQGWVNVGPLATVVTGSLRLIAPPAGATSVYGRQVWPFFLVRGKQTIFAFASRPPYDHRCDIAYDVGTDLFSCDVDGQTLRWSRFGRYLGPEPASDMSRHRVIVRDGTVWVRYEDAAAMSLTVEEDAAER